jgi:hypothetical protein
LGARRSSMARTSGSVGASPSVCSTVATSLRRVLLIGQTASGPSSWGHSCISSPRSASLVSASASMNVAWYSAPSNGRPSTCRTVLCAPSHPTTNAALIERGSPRCSNVTSTASSLGRRHERRLVLDHTPSAPQRLGEQRLGGVLRHHRDERIRARGGGERELREPAIARHHRDRNDAVGRREKRRNQRGHVEDLEGPREDRQGLGVFGLSRPLLDDPPAQRPARAFVSQREADRPGANDEDIDVGC